MRLWERDMPSHFSRPTLIAAANQLTFLDHAEFDNLMLSFSIDQHITYGPGLSKQNKANELIRYATENPEHETEDGSNLWDDVVENAAALAQPDRNIGFVRALARDGYVLTDDRSIRAALPEVANLVEADDEVHGLLDEQGLDVALGHLDQAIENHANGNWAAANGELRKVLENLFDELAEKLVPACADATPKGYHRRQLLANLEPPFLSEALGELSSGKNEGKNFVNGLF